MVRTVVDPGSLVRSPGGNVSGRIFLRGPSGDFPDDHWSDFPAVILGWWIAGLTDFVRGQQPFFAAYSWMAP